MTVYRLETEREPSTARLPEVSEFDFILQTDGRNYNIDIGGEGGVLLTPIPTTHFGHFS